MRLQPYCETCEREFKLVISGWAKLAIECRTGIDDSYDHPTLDQACNQGIVTHGMDVSKCEQT